MSEYQVMFLPPYCWKIQKRGERETWCKSLSSLKFSFLSLSLSNPRLFNVSSSTHWDQIHFPFFLIIMCPLRFLLVFFSAVLAGYFAWKTVSSSPEIFSEDDDGSPVELNEKQGLCFKKVIAFRWEFWFSNFFVFIISFIRF